MVAGVVPVQTMLVPALFTATDRTAYVPEPGTLTVPPLAAVMAAFKAAVSSLPLGAATVTPGEPTETVAAPLFDGSATLVATTW